MVPSLVKAYLVSTNEMTKIVARASLVLRVLIHCPWRSSAQCVQGGLVTLLGEYLGPDQALRGP